MIDLNSTRLVFSLCTMRRAGLVRVGLGVVFLSATAVFGQTHELSGMPVKIEVKCNSLNPVKGEVITVRITLLDAGNHPAAANKDFPIKLEFRSQSGEIESSNVIIVKAGETGHTTQLTLRDAGVSELTASNAELATGGLIVSVRASSPVPAPTQSMVTPSGPGLLQVVYSGEEGAQPSTSPPAVTGTPIIKLDYYPKRRFRADKTDAATIVVNLDEPARDDMQIQLSSDMGPLDPDPIKIQKGEMTGRATLVADHPGSIQFWYVWATPPASAPNAIKTVEFSSPVWGWIIVPKSPRIGLFESEEIGLQLVDSKGTAVPADQERQANLSIASGTGQFEEWSVKFDSQTGYATAKFIPTAPGVIRVMGTTLYLQNQFASFVVTTSFWLLLLCAIGGTLGGLVSYLTEKPSASWARIFIGLITGFVLYWAFLFGVVHLPSFSHGILLNPFVATVLSIVGGWIGTNVFTILLKPLGLRW